MTDDRATAPGCRDVAVVTGILLTAATVMVAIGLSLIGRDDCTGACEVVALTSLYAGGPVSGALGVLYGGVHLAWPLDITLWVVVAFAAARWAGGRDRSPFRVAVALILVALVVGLVLSRFVELDITG
ncbi:MAG TPA: hypothetical protein VF246_03440 [Acidimicrobiia bacterium]